jgi:hypothetical protein
MAEAGYKGGGGDRPLTGEGVGEISMVDPDEGFAFGEWTKPRHLRDRDHDFFKIPLLPDFTQILSWPDYETDLDQSNLYPLLNQHCTL